ncbi:hypothetical protein ABEX25_22085 [Paenibacillus thiaminolyticus]|uniref:hypothetical protein n=1 Tax=Paenibacillus thiaminolyticus TaxID=49283 RepID=UPI000DFD40EC|nr:hypothetical protein [Paenibacillus thiaminolyticus]MDG0876410.1 hypothetical protein [Paenibacillus thiaminolyticus]WCF10432.1 hypothetical protein NDS46_11540 [Paenibacillus thiaminolyticus]WII39776.1 hypothetical protein O0V01_12090 [Paenibacillus thiaminolyticus]SUA95517.1 Uncharacterised protein [Paenibacillus thiaminolyticus]
MKPLICTSCEKPLNASQWSSDGKYKSCPSCSTRNGTEHVFFPYPDSFGTTPKRATAAHPEGPQSHCTSCRGTGSSAGEPILCSAVER